MSSCPGRRPGSFSTAIVRFPAHFWLSQEPSNRVYIKNIVLVEMVFVNMMMISCVRKRGPGSSLGHLPRKQLILSYRLKLQVHRVCNRKVNMSNIKVWEKRNCLVVSFGYFLITQTYGFEFWIQEPFKPCLDVLWDLHKQVPHLQRNSHLRSVLPCTSLLMPCPILPRPKTFFSCPAPVGEPDYSKPLS